MRAGLADDNDWVCRVTAAGGVAPAQGARTAPPSTLTNLELRGVVRAAQFTAWEAASGAVPRTATRTRAGRTSRVPLAPPVHVNPVNRPYSAAASAPGYLFAPDAVARPILQLRCAHLPLDHVGEGDGDSHWLRGDYCVHCVSRGLSDDVALVVDSHECITDDERRWRHVVHALVTCEVRDRVGYVYPSLTELRADLLWLAAPSPGAMGVVCAAFDASVRDARSPAVHSHLLPFMLDPVGCCPDDCPRKLAVRLQSVVAGFLTLAGCSRVQTRVLVATRDALRTPLGTYTRACLDAAVAELVPCLPPHLGVRPPQPDCDRVSSVPVCAARGVLWPPCYGRLHGDSSDSDDEVQLCPVLATVRPGASAPAEAEGAVR